MCSSESGSGRVAGGAEESAGGGARFEVIPESSQRTDAAVGEPGPVPQTTAEPIPRSPDSHTGCVNPQFKGEVCHFSTISGTKQNCNYDNITFKMLRGFHFHSLGFLHVCLFAIHGNPCTSGACVGQVFWGCSLTPFQDPDMLMVCFTSFFSSCVCVCVVLSVCLC